MSEPHTQPETTDATGGCVAVELTVDCVSVIRLVPRIRPTLESHAVRA